MGKKKSQENGNKWYKNIEKHTQLLRKLTFAHQTNILEISWDNVQKYGN